MRARPSFTPEHDAGNTHYLRRAAAVLLLLILMMAAFFRFWRLEQMPPGLYHDEAYNGLDALSLVQGKTFPQFYEGWELYQYDAHANRPATKTRWPLFFEGNYGREPAHIYLMALSIKLFGAAPFAIRAVPAFFGVLAVFATFLAAKTLLGARGSQSAPPFHAPATMLAPLVAAFTLAILFPAIHFSRFGLRMMVFVFVETLTIYCFWQGINSGGRAVNDAPPPARRLTTSTLWFSLAGFLLGLGLYIYAAARLFPLLFVIFVPFWFWRDRGAGRRHWLDVGLMAGTAVLTALPLLLYFWRTPYFFVFRLAYVSNKGKGAIEGKPWLTWLYNAGRVLRGLFWQGETHLRHNLPGRPYLDPLQSIACLAGAGAVSKRLLQPRIFFLFLWLLVMLLPTVFSGDAPHFGRMSGAAPVVAIFVGLGADWFVKVISTQYSVFSKGKLMTGYWLLITVLFISALWTGYDYFVRYAHHPQIAADFYLPEWQMGQYAASFGADTAVYLTPTQAELATLYFALGGSTRLHNYAGEEGAVPLGIPGRAALYLVRPAMPPISLTRLQTAFPTGALGKSGDGYLSFFVPANAPRPLPEHQSTHSFGDQLRLVGWTVKVEGEVTAVTLTWEALKEMDRAYTAYVHLIGPDGTPAAQLDRQPGGYPTSDWQPGERVMDTYTIPLPPGITIEDVTIQTGFYYLPTLEALGEPARLTK